MIGNSSITDRARLTARRDKMNIFAAKPKGFTLIELAIVVGIIGILAAVAITIFDSFSDKSKIDAMRSDMLVAAAAQEKFYLSNGRYATTGNDKAALVAYYDFPKDTDQMRLKTGVVVRDGVGMGYWVSGIRKIRGDIHCWLYTSSFMDTTEKSNFRELKSGESTGYNGLECSGW